MVTKVIEVKIEDLQPSPYNPHGRVKPDRIRGLVVDIEAAGGVIVPIVVTENVNGKGKKYTIIDGHRRWASARELKHTTINAIVVDASDPYDLWSDLNRNPRKINQTEWMEVYHRGFPIDKIPHMIAKNILKLREVAGPELFASLVEKSRSPMVYRNLVLVSHYVGMGDDLKFLKLVLEWFEIHQQQFAVRRFMGSGLDPEILKKHILENTPLKITLV